MSDKFKKDRDSDKEIKEKTETARKALGVPKRFKVVVVIPVAGYEQMKPMTVMAMDEEDAKVKVGDIAGTMEEDIDGYCWELDTADVTQVDYSEWQYEITSEE